MSDSGHVALLGGTFNPIHNGHLKGATEAADLCAIDTVYFIPSYLPPHRELIHNVSAAHRFAMVRLACQSDPRFNASDVEVRREQKSYSFDTVNHFLGAEPAGTRVSFLIGTDAFAEIDTWHRVGELLGLCDFLVMVRPGDKGDLTDRLPETLRGAFASIQPDKLDHESGKMIRLVQIEGIELSSTTVRERIRQGSSIDNLVPPSVAQYITQTGLYH